MDLLRDLIRDLIGIIFPGTLVILLFMFAYWSITSLFIETNFHTLLNAENNFSVLFVFLALCYIAGQFLRIKRLGDLDIKALEYYKENNAEKNKILLSDMQEVENHYFNSSNDNLKELIHSFNESVPEPERFPYEISNTMRRLKKLPFHYNSFYHNFSKSGLLKSGTFYQLL